MSVWRGLEAWWVLNQCNELVVFSSTRLLAKVCANECACCDCDLNVLAAWLTARMPQTAACEVASEGQWQQRSTSPCVSLQGKDSAAISILSASLLVLFAPGRGQLITASVAESPTLLSTEPLNEVSPCNCLSINELGLLPTFGEAAFPPQQCDCPLLCRGEGGSSGCNCMGQVHLLEDRVYESCGRQGCCSQGSCSDGKSPWQPGIALPFYFGQGKQRAKGQEAFMNLCLMLPCLSAGTSLGVHLSMS